MGELALYAPAIAGLAVAAATLLSAKYAKRQSRRRDATPAE